jgi:hypothetical protein
MWKSKVVLNSGETLKHERSSNSGFMQETDIDIYSIVRKDGSVSGSVKVTDNTAVKGLKRTIHVVQTDNEGNIVIDESWQE